MKGLNTINSSPGPGTTVPLQSGKAQIPTLLAPAGDWECARAAVENGADAIYFGLDRFNARMRAKNFSTSDLPALMSYLHGRGVKGYVTFNTLVFETELAAAEQHLRAIIEAGVDAAIVQDAGVCRLIRGISSDFPIHASTQMTVTSAAGVDFARELGCSVVVLARECSLQEIENIQKTALPTMPLEVFVHGALCVAYSGQCLTSESLGGRSANRGECAQACRMPYQLIADGREVPLGDRRYLLSPQDLAGIDVLPDLVRLGVSTLKIEGRLKTPEYVANITGIYRRALDEIADGGVRRQLSSDVRYDLEMGFSRGLYTGWFRGIDNQSLVHARFGKKRGVYLGTVSLVNGTEIHIATLEAPLKAGDGLVFDAGRPDSREEGGRAHEVITTSGQTKIRFRRGDIDPARIHVGDKIWKTSDPQLDKRLRNSFVGDSPRFTRPVTMSVHGEQGDLLRLVCRDKFGRLAQAQSAMPLIAAEKEGLTTERLFEQLGRLGGTPFRLERVENQLVGNLFVPVSELNRLRRDVAAELKVISSTPLRWKLNERVVNACRVDSPAPLKASQPCLAVLVRALPQLQAALSLDSPLIYCEFEDPKKYREAVEIFRAWQAKRGLMHSFGTGIFASPPRITKSGEDWILQQVISSEADGYLVRNYDHLRFFSGLRRIGDFSLNVANSFTAELFKRDLDLEHLTASYDLNFSQLEALLTSAPPDWFEVTIHQHMPMFHMEHCVFCAFLSEGKDFKNCGRPCDQHKVKLRDRVGAEHVLKADAGCRNTVFNSKAQSGAEFVPQLLSLGVHRFRIEFLEETPDVVCQTIPLYRDLLAGRRRGDDLWRELKALNQLGVTRGSLLHP